MTLDWLRACFLGPLRSAPSIAACVSGRHDDEAAATTAAVHRSSTTELRTSPADIQSSTKTHLELVTTCHSISSSDCEFNLSRAQSEAPSTPVAAEEQHPCVGPPLAMQIGGAAIRKPPTAGLHLTVARGGSRSVRRSVVMIPHGLTPIDEASSGYSDASASSALWSQQAVPAASRTGLRRSVSTPMAQQKLNGSPKLRGASLLSKQSVLRRKIKSERDLGLLLQASVIIQHQGQQPLSEVISKSASPAAKYRSHVPRSLPPTLNEADPDPSMSLASSKSCVFPPSRHSRVNYSHRNQSHHRTPPLPPQTKYITVQQLRCGTAFLIWMSLLPD